MSAATIAARPQHLRVAAVWGTTVIAMKTLARGESFLLGDEREAVLPIPEGVDMAAVPVRGAAGGWEIDARGVHAGLLRLRGRDEDPLSVARSGAPIPIVPGDFGVLQYGLFTIFFQYTTPPTILPSAWGPELLVVLALFSSVVFHGGAFGLLRALLTPPPIEKPLELTSPEEFAARFGLRRAVIEEPPPPAPSAGDSAGGAGVKDPGAEDTKPQGGGRKIAGAEGKLGNKGPNERAEIPGEIRPTTSYGGLSDVLSSDTGEEIKNTLKTITTVSDALSGLKSQNLVLGGGPGTGLRNSGSGGGGAGVAFDRARSTPGGCGSGGFGADRATGGRGSGGMVGAARAAARDRRGAGGGPKDARVGVTTDGGRAAALGGADPARRRIMGARASTRASAAQPEPPRRDRHLEDRAWRLGGVGVHREHDSTTPASGVRRPPVGA